MRCFSYVFCDYIQFYLFVFFLTATPRSTSYKIQPNSNMNPVVLLEKLDLSKFKGSTITVCAECSKPFDNILEKKDIESYEKLLEYESKMNEHLSKELTKVENQWHDELKKWSILAISCQ